MTGAQQKQDEQECLDDETTRQGAAGTTRATHLNSLARRLRARGVLCACPSTCVVATWRERRLLVLGVAHDAVEDGAALIQHVIVVEHLVVAHVAPALHRFRRHRDRVPLALEVVKRVLQLVPLPTPCVRASEAQPHGARLLHVANSAGEAAHKARPQQAQRWVM